ncbi:MLO1 [Senna tora]|uniref:MLO-like protein n=1 Tax=Senna tora TaxID=362788 RepID=A0A834WEW7_9FABA|nr:MLO1 [Senna tora]
MEDPKKGLSERTLEETPTWAVAVWFKKKHKHALYEALEKVKDELMLLGFISFLLTVFQDSISNICISREVASTWRPCSASYYEEQAKTPKYLQSSPSRNLIQSSDFTPTTPRRSLATKGYDKCGLMRRWKMWENETKTVEYQFYNDPDRFRFTRETTFGRRHLNMWSKSSISLWIVSFFRQFFGSVTKVDYLALRHGFITAHLAPGSEASFDFRNPVIWLFAVLALLTNTHGWYPYFWLPFIPLIIILLVGTKLQMIITKMGLRIQERGEVVKGAPVVEPGDDLFWFNNPRFLLNLIHFVLFQYEFSITSCFHSKTVDIAIRLTTGIIIQFLCSYVTLPLYALVTQMGTSMKPTIFNERVATALKNWHHTAKKHVKDGKHSEANTPLTSGPPTPSHGMSPVHLLYRHPAGHSDSAPTSPSNYENDRWDVEEGTPYPTTNTHDPTTLEAGQEIQMIQVHGPSEMDLPPGPRPVRAQHDSGSIAQFSFKNSHNNRNLR